MTRKRPFGGRFLYSQASRIAMLEVSTCKKYLENKNISEERVKEIRDYLYAISREIVLKNMNEYEKTVKEKRKNV